MKKVFVLTMLFAFLTASVCFAARVWVKSPDGKACSIYSKYAQPLGGGSYKIIATDDENGGANCKNSAGGLVHHFEIGDIASNQAAAKPAPAMDAPEEKIAPEADSDEESIAPAPAPAPAPAGGDEADEEDSGEEDSGDEDW